MANNQGPKGEINYMALPAIHGDACWLCCRLFIGGEQLAESHGYRVHAKCAIKRRLDEVLAAKREIGKFNAELRPKRRR